MQVAVGRLRVGHEDVTPVFCQQAKGVRQLPDGLGFIEAVLLDCFLDVGAGAIPEHAAAQLSKIKKGLGRQVVLVIESPRCFARGP